MRIPQSGLDITNPAFPLLQGLISYWGVTTANGLAGGTTVVCGGLATQPSYDGHPVKILTGPAAGQTRTIEVHAGNTLTVGVPFSNNPAGAVQQITAGTLFVILSILGGGGGPGPAPAEGLSYYGVVDSVVGATFTIGALAGLGAFKFVGVTNPYSAFVLRDAGDLGAAPQGEIQAITAYVTATGAFTTAGFGGGGVTAGDEILIVNPALANAIIGFLLLNVPLADSGNNVTAVDVIGNKTDTATPDDMSLLATSSLMRDLKRVLLRLSGAGIFSADIQGVARTELDTMLAQLATYFVAAGAAMSLQVNGNVARTNLQLIINDMNSVLGADGVNVFNPTIQGAARTDLDTALNVLASYLVAAGAAMSIQVNGNAARTNIQQAFSDFTVVFGADGANVFNPTIQGVARTDLDTALAQLATYFVAAGAAMALQVNNNLARTNLEQALNDYFAVVGCNGANIFSTTIQGVARTTIEAAFDGLAAYFVAAGAALSVTIDPGGAARTTLATLWNDLGQMLAGAAGITTFPIRALPANGVSLAKALRYATEVKPEFGTPTSATYITASAAEETILTTAYTVPFWFDMDIHLNTLVAGDDFTIRVYKRVGGVDYLKSVQNFVDAQTIKIYEIERLMGNLARQIKVTVQRNSATNRGFLYDYQPFKQPVA